jgi:hypothetical protein
MLIKSNRDPIQIFTKESCEKMKNMDRQERLEMLSGAVTAFFQGRHPAQVASPAAAIARTAGVDEDLVQRVMLALGQKGMTGPSDAPHLMNLNRPVIAGLFDTSIIDPLTTFGFEDLFSFVDMREAGQEYFDILDVTNAITFTERKSGSPAKVYGISSGSSRVTLMEKAAGIGIEDRWIDYNQFWNLNEAIVEARSKYYDQQATDHYALLAAISAGQNEAFSTDDITTINNACANILNDCSGKGFTLTGNEVFELRANILLKQRIEKAFTLTFASPRSDANQLVFTVNRVYTTKLAATSYYVGLPGRKAKRGTWKDLYAEPQRDAAKGGTDVFYAGQYNAAIGEEDQFRRCGLS